MRPMTTMWGTNIYFTPIMHFDFPVPTGNVVFTKRPDYLQVQLEGRDETWQIRRGPTHVLNADGDVYLHDGLRPVAIGGRNHVEHAYLNGWQIVLGYDFRGLEKRAAVESREFGERAKLWLLNPCGAFPYCTILKPPAQGVLKVPIGEGVLIAGARRFSSREFGRNYFKGEAVATLDHSSFFGRVALSVYDPKTQLPLYKWFLDEEEGRFYAPIEDGGRLYYFKLSPDLDFFFFGRRFIPSSSFFRGDQVFRIKARGNEKFEIMVSKGKEISATRGLAWSFADPPPIVIGNFPPGFPHPKLSGFFSAKARLRRASRSKKCEMEILFGGRLHEFDGERCKQLGIGKWKHALTIEAANGEAVAFYPKLAANVLHLFEKWGEIIREYETRRGNFDKHFENRVRGSHKMAFELMGNETTTEIAERLKTICLQAQVILVLIRISGAKR